MNARFSAGARVRVVRDLERFPHFVVPAGSLGTVVDLEDDMVFAVRLDEKIVGAEDWENEVHWSNGETPDGDLEIVEVFPAGGSSVGQKNLSVAQPGRSEIMDRAIAAKGSLAVYIVQSADGDVEVLDSRPRWNWTADGQTVRVANVNGGDAVVVIPGEHLPECPVVDARARLEADLELDPESPYLHGAQIEYYGRGDQEVELCECGAIDDILPEPTEKRSLTVVLSFEPTEADEIDRRLEALAETPGLELEIHDENLLADERSYIYRGIE